MLLERILGSAQAFPFPKSIYAVADCLRVAGAAREDALILDFFGGSGTTTHATALLNAEDSGNRQCILVTNNEVSEKAAKELAERNTEPGTPKWESEGICEAVTWPRITHVFLVTDSVEAFHEMRSQIGKSKRCVQLYKSYLDNFKINLESTHAD